MKPYVITFRVALAPGLAGGFALGIFVIRARMSPNGALLTDAYQSALRALSGAAKRGR